MLLTGFCAVPGPGRAGVQLRHVIRALMQEHSVDVLVVREGDQSYVERYGNVRILRVPVGDGAAGAASEPTVQIQSYQRALKRQLEGADYEIVHCRDSWAGLVVLEAKRHLGYSIIYDVTRSPLGEATLDPRLYAEYTRHEQACTRAADIVFVPTLAARQALTTVANGTVVLAPLGVDVDRFDWDEPPTNAAPRVLYAGSIEPSRGVRVLIRAMQAIGREVDAKLVLAGPAASPRFETALRDSIRELGISDKVERLGPVEHEQVPALIAAATVCVIPAALDLVPNPMVGFPSKLLEYMACRRAIVAPKRETVSMVVRDNQEALLFEPGDPADLARCVLRLLAEPALRERLATAAYERVRREFTASAVRRSVRAAYADLSHQLAGAQPAAQAMSKSDLMSDDEFEATVIEQAAEVAAGDTGLHRMAAMNILDEDLVFSSHAQRLPTQPGEVGGDTVVSDDRPVESQMAGSKPRPEAGSWTESAMTASAVAEESMITNVAAVLWSRDVNDDDGTPADGMASATAPANRDNAFVAGEIDIPTPTPQFHVPEVIDSADSDTGESFPVRGRNPQ